MSVIEKDLTRQRRLDALGKEKRAKARENPTDFVPTVRWYYGAWEFLLSFSATTAIWGFSAMLYPRGRGSVDDDWAVLGMMAAAVGAPPEEPIGDTLRCAPNAVHRWLWPEDVEHPSPPKETPS